MLVQRNGSPGSQICIRISYDWRYWEYVVSATAAAATGQFVQVVKYGFQRQNSYSQALCNVAANTVN